MDIASLTEYIPGVPDEIRHFGHVPGGRVEFGPGMLARLGDFCAEQEGASHVLLVSDRGVARAGQHVARGVAAIAAAGLEVTVFDEASENPTTEDVARVVQVAREAGIDVIVGLGGGSSMDTAKGCNFILSNGGVMKDYQGVGKAAKPMLPFLAVPTTAGTGSECQSFALIADAETHMKMACGDRKSAAAVAILDPDLTLTQPARVTAVTGIDAMAHALETAVCRARTSTSFEYSRLAFRLLDRAFEEVINDGSNLEARARMQLGAAYAGTAIEGSMLGLAHALANPLTAHFGIVHGEAIGILLPHVIRFNSENAEVAEIYQGLDSGCLARRVETMRGVAGLPGGLSRMGVDPAMIPRLAAEAREQWTASFNPRTPEAGDIEGLYHSALLEDRAAHSAP